MKLLNHKNNIPKKIAKEIITICDRLKWLLPLYERKRFFEDGDYFVIDNLNLGSIEIQFSTQNDSCKLYYLDKKSKFEFHSEKYRMDDQLEDGILRLDWWNNEFRFLLSNSRYYPNGQFDCHVTPYLNSSILEVYKEEAQKSIKQISQRKEDPSIRLDKLISQINAQSENRIKEDFSDDPMVLLMSYLLNPNSILNEKKEIKYLTNQKHDKHFVDFGQGYEIRLIDVKTPLEICQALKTIEINGIEVSQRFEACMGGKSHHKGIFKIDNYNGLKIKQRDKVITLTPENYYDLDHNLVCGELIYEMLKERCSFDLKTYTQGKDCPKKFKT